MFHEGIEAVFDAASSSWHASISFLTQLLLSPRLLEVSGMASARQRTSAALVYTRRWDDLAALGSTSMSSEGKGEEGIVGVTVQESGKLIGVIGTLAVLAVVRVSGVVGVLNVVGVLAVVRGLEPLVSTSESSRGRNADEPLAHQLPDILFLSAGSDMT